MCDVFNVTYQYFLIICHITWSQSETTTDNQWEKDPLVQHRKYTGQEHPADV